jgi:hypothetical protein
MKAGDLVFPEFLVLLPIRLYLAVGNDVFSKGGRQAGLQPFGDGGEHLLPNLRLSHLRIILLFVLELWFYIETQMAPQTVFKVLWY